MSQARAALLSAPINPVVIHFMQEASELAYFVAVLEEPNVYRAPTTEATPVQTSNDEIPMEIDMQTLWVDTVVQQTGVD